jgi:putative transposase
MEKYRNKYRIQSTRLQNWDYSSNAAYFVTICTYGRICFFGKIFDGEMELSGIGKLINQFWNEIPIHFPFVILDAFVVMPNHIHGIIVINKPGTLGSIINQFKRVCTIHANKIDMNFAWQPRFYDQIIRNYDSYVKIKDYINNNPARWNEPVF